MGIQFLIPFNAAAGIASTNVATNSLEISNTASLNGLSIATVNDVSVETIRAQGVESLLAPLAGPSLTGTPTAPTATIGTNSTQLATTAFVQNTIDIFAGVSPGSVATLNDISNALAADTTGGVMAAILNVVSSEASRAQDVESVLGLSITTEQTRALEAEQLFAPKTSPLFTGIPIAPTANTSDSSNQIATTKYVRNSIDTFAGVSPGVIAALNTISTALSENVNGNVITTILEAVSSEQSRATIVESTLAESISTEQTRALAAEALFAPKASPQFTGIPTAPNAGNLTSSSQVATIDYVQNAIGSISDISPGTVAALAELSAAIASDPNGQAINSMLSTISLETSRALGAESALRLGITNLSGVVSSETARALGVESALRTDLNAMGNNNTETTRALAAESALRTDLNALGGHIDCSGSVVAGSLEIKGIDGNNNYSFTVGNSSQSGTDEMIIRKGSIPLMKISTVGVTGSVGTDTVLFSAPVDVRNDLSVSGQLSIGISGSVVIGDQTFDRAQLIQLGNYLKAVLVM